MIVFLILGLFVVNSCAVSVPSFPVVFTGSDEAISGLADEVSNQFVEEYINFQKTGIETTKFRQLTKQLANLHSGKALFTENVVDLSTRDQFFVCTTCRAMINVFFRMFRDPNGELNGPNKDELSKSFFVDICSQRLKVQTQEVCEGLFDFNWPVLDYIFQNSLADSRSLCGTLPISFCKVKQQEFEWSLNIDTNGPAFTGPKSDIPEKSANDLILLHLTDIHYDPLYEPGSLAECDEIMCCQRHKDLAMGTSKAAGYWSDYRVCDSPWHMITDAMDHIKRTHTKIDYIYNTGDVVDHMIWATSKQKNNEVLTKINNLLEQKFPDIPVYSCVGNHEPHPLNVFGPDDVPEAINVKWMYEHLYSLWSKWLPASTKSTILKGGYYTVVPKPGFRIISLNNNDCYIFNWWIYFDGSSVIPQLVWLHDTLLAAEKAGEYVHILAHIPSGDSDCWPVWAREYNRIIERFNHIISGIFNGHTHVDEMNVHYSSEGHAMGISWNGGSLTSYTNKNPNYRVYEVESKSMQIIDHETWIFNITDANIYGAERSPNWFKEYVFSEAYTKDLSPAGIDTLLNKMAEQPDLLRQYWRYKVTLADPRVEPGCDRKCLQQVICRLATTVYNQKERCQELRQKLAIALDNEVTTTTQAPSVSEKPTTTEKPGGDGASSITATKIPTILAVFYVAMKLMYSI